MFGVYIIIVIITLFTNSVVYSYAWKHFPYLFIGGATENGRKFRLEAAIKFRNAKEVNV